MANTCLFSIMFTHVCASLLMSKNTTLCIFDSIICTILWYWYTQVQSHRVDVLWLNGNKMIPRCQENLEPFVLPKMVLFLVWHVHWQAEQRSVFNSDSASLLLRTCMCYPTVYHFGPRQRCWNNIWTKKFCKHPLALPLSTFFPQCVL